MAEPIEAREIDPETGEIRRGGEMTSGAPPPLASGESPSPRSDAPSVPAIIEPHTYRPQLVLEPEAARDLVDQVKAMQRSVLVQGVDYDVIPGTGTKPTLLKPGAERLMQVFGLGHEMVRGEVDPDPEGGHWGVWYTCRVTKTLLDGREIVVSSCEAYASYDEDKFWDAKWEGPKGNRKKVGMKKSPWNTVAKMAQKRALVGACLTATATSGLFTQDVEEYREPEPRRQQASTPRSSEPRMVTSFQLTKLGVMFTKAGITDRTERLAAVANMIGHQVTSSKELTIEEASTVIEMLIEQVGDE